MGIKSILACTLAVSIAIFVYAKVSSPGSAIFPSIG